MKIKYIGHSCFLFTSGEGTRVLIDPYKPGAYGGGLTYRPVADEADIVAVTHGHEDHADLDGLPNQPLQVRAGCMARGIDFDVVDTYHDNEGGRKRGPNRVVCFEMDGIRVCHLGDLGHTLSDEQVAAIGRVDILLIPVGGHFTIGKEEAAEVIGQLNPRICVPMHYKTEKCAFPIEPVEAFLEGKASVRRSSSSEVVVNQADLPESTSILLLPHAN